MQFARDIMASPPRPAAKKQKMMVVGPTTAAALPAAATASDSGHVAREIAIELVPTNDSRSAPPAGDAAKGGGGEGAQLAPDVAPVRVPAEVVQRLGTVQAQMDEAGVDVRPQPFPMPFQRLALVTMVDMLLSATQQHPPTAMAQAHAPRQVLEAALAIDFMQVELCAPLRTQIIDAVKGSLDRCGFGDGFALVARVLGRTSFGESLLSELPSALASTVAPNGATPVKLCGGRLILPLPSHGPYPHDSLVLPANCPLSRDDATVLGWWLVTASHDVADVNMSGNPLTGGKIYGGKPIDGKDISCVCAMFPILTRVVKLNVSNCGLGPTAMVELAKLVRDARAALDEVNVSQNPIGFEGGKALANAIPKSSLQCIVIGDKSTR
eukprot:COSAG01_NODE_16193_length_1261_cov_1.190189_1_plen_381_part_10